jgi:hypothetical protein
VELGSYEEIKPMLEKFSIHCIREPVEDEATAKPAAAEEAPPAEAPSKEAPDEEAFKEKGEGREPKQHELAEVKRKIRRYFIEEGYKPSTAARVEEHI